MSAEIDLLVIGLGVGFFAGSRLSRFFHRKQIAYWRSAYQRVLSAWALEVTEHGSFLQILAKGKDGPRA